ncbi:hypothetical protein NDU88_011519 [Pleurodeles waltl]|uniref:Uncharacterized protein n=1 Tax=Pleurodeles waltl TaxID=8319 RepID=A0AAV7R381_PLEWA|nr:hypothetical protein NDU88_011519 [Pleurodeles waltl]
MLGKHRIGAGDCAEAGAGGRSWGALTGTEKKPCAETAAGVGEAIIRCGSTERKWQEPEMPSMDQPTHQTPGDLQAQRQAGVGWHLMDNAPNGTEIGTMELHFCSNSSAPDRWNKAILAVVAIPRTRSHQ